MRQFSYEANASENGEKKMRHNLIVKNDKNETIGTFPLYESAPCALIVATFGQYVMFGNLVVWYNEQDGDASESYDNFARIVEERIMRQTISENN
jgi:hypothetical protein